MKRYLHVALIVVLLLLMANLLIGIGVFHESLGLIMGLLVLVHLVQNRTWWHPYVPLCYSQYDIL